MRQKVKIWHYYEKRVITVNMESSIVCAVPSETSMFAHQAVSSGINLDLLNRYSLKTAQVPFLMS